MRQGWARTLRVQRGRLRAHVVDRWSLLGIWGYVRGRFAEALADSERMGLRRSCLWARFPRLGKEACAALLWSGVVGVLRMLVPFVLRRRRLLRVGVLRAGLGLLLRGVGRFGRGVSDYRRFVYARCRLHRPCARRGSALRGIGSASWREREGMRV